MDGEIETSRALSPVDAQYRLLKLRRIAVFAITALSGPAKT
jgi:hypothetical protein